MNKEIVNKIFGLLLPVAISLTGCRSAPTDPYSAEGQIIHIPSVEGPLRLVTESPTSRQDLQGVYKLSLVGENEDILLSHWVRRGSKGPCMMSNLIIRPVREDGKVIIQFIPTGNNGCDDRFDSQLDSVVDPITEQNRSASAL